MGPSTYLLTHSQTHSITTSSDGDNPPKKGGIGGWFSRLMRKKDKAPPDEDIPNEGDTVPILTCRHPDLTYPNPCVNPVLF